MHTPKASPYHIVVIEIILTAHEKDGSVFEMSAGWTFFHPFNTEKNGLDVTKIWNTNLQDDASSTTSQDIDPDMLKAKAYLFTLTNQYSDISRNTSCSLFHCTNADEINGWISDTSSNSWSSLSVQVY